MMKVVVLFAYCFVFSIPLILIILRGIKAEIFSRYGAGWLETLVSFLMFVFMVVVYGILDMLPDAVPIVSYTMHDNIMLKYRDIYGIAYCCTLPSRILAVYVLFFFK